MSVESVVDAYETIMGREDVKGMLNFGNYVSSDRTEAGQYVAEVTVGFIGQPDAKNQANAVGVAVHTNPSVALLLAKAIAVSELVGEPTLPFYEDTQELRATPVSVTPVPVAAQQAAPSVVAQAAAVATASVDNSTRPVTGPDGKVRCWEVDEHGHECGAEIKPWDGKSSAELGAARKSRYGLVLCPKHIAIRKKAGN